MTLRAVVIGGGLGGTAAAVALTQAGLDVRVYQQAARLAEVGAGVSLAPNGLRMLQRLDVGDAVARLGARHVATQLRLSDGRAADHQPHQFARAGANVGIHRADLLALLVEQLPPGTVRTGHRCTGFRQDAGQAVVSFANGASDMADVVIGADGIHSVMQGFVVEPADPVFSRVLAYRGLVPSVEGYPAGTLRMWVGEGKHFLAFPVRAGRLLTYVGFVTSATAVHESWSARGDPAALTAHFQGWDPLIGEIIGRKVRLIDSAEETALDTQRMLAEHSLDAQSGEGRYRFVASDDQQQFLALGQRFFGDTIDRVEIRTFG